MMARRLLMLAAPALLTVACAMAPEPATPSRGALLADWMAGTYASTAQAAEDPDCYDIRLFMRRMWHGRTDGIWMYVEQSVATALDKPYRQRVYQVTHVGADLYESRVFELPDPAAAVGAWRDKNPLAALAPKDLVVREGASIILRDLGDHFAGSTLGRLCKSDFRGASYATSEVTVTDDRIVSWDRGFDDKGQHVWGATKGGYVFLKTKDFPLK